MYYDIGLIPTTVPTTCYLLPTTYYSTYYLLPATYYLLPTTYSSYEYSTSTFLQYLLRVRVPFIPATCSLFNVTQKEDGGVSRTGRFAIKYCMVLGTKRNIRRTVRRSARPESYRYTYSCVPWDFRVRTCARYVLALGL